MDWSWLTPGLVVALCALFIALFNYRRSNYAVIRVISVQSSYVASVNRGHYWQFKIVIQNLGIPLHNLGMSLIFSPDGFGSCNEPLKTDDGKPTREGQFAKGAITEFTLATDRFPGGGAGFIRVLTDLNAQDARLTVYADRYSMWSYRLHDRFWFLKRRWNRFAFWFTELCRRDVKTPRGTPGVKYLFSMPKFESPGRELLEFAANVRKQPPVDQQPVFGRPFAPPPQSKPR